MLWRFVQNFRSSTRGVYVIMVVLVAISVVLVNNLRKSRMGRAWMAVREDEVAAGDGRGNTVGVKAARVQLGCGVQRIRGHVLTERKLSLVFA